MIGVKKIYLLDYGWLSGEMGWFIPDPATWSDKLAGKIKEPTWVEIPVTGALIEHRDGYVLIDAGSHPEAEKVWVRGVWEVFPMSKFTDENKLENQLKFIGLKPSDINFVVFTHLHLDHVGQAYLFKEYKTPFIAHFREINYAALLYFLGKAGAYQPIDMENLKGANWHPFKDQFMELLPGINLILVGGHTPGSILVEVKTEAGNTYIFTGDFLHLPEELNVESKGWLLGNAEEYLIGVKKLKLMNRKPRTHLVISHDPKLWEKYPKAPKYLE